MSEPRYDELRRHSERCLAEHGDTHLGVNWPRKADADMRHRVMLEMMPRSNVAPVSVLDVGCGTSQFNDYLRAAGRDDIRYSGLDISEKFIAVSRAKYPDHTYWCADVLAPDAPTLPAFDYVVINGVFTSKQTLTFDEMRAFYEQMLVKLFPLARHALAFNAMSKHVDWEVDTLFHLPFDDMARFVRGALTRHLTIRADHGLYDYTVYLHREGGRWPGS